MKRPRQICAGALLALFVAVPAVAEEGVVPEKASTLVVYGDDPCPQPRDAEEIVVCARKPEDERYRIPKELREKTDDRGSVAWGTRFSELEDATRFSRPNSCSVVGTWGQTGCYEMSIRQWRAERRALADERH